MKTCQECVFKELVEFPHAYEPEPAWCGFKQDCFRQHLAQLEIIRAEPVLLHRQIIAGQLGWISYLELQDILDAEHDQIHIYGGE
jgi:hypothetical protein